MRRLWKMTQVVAICGAVAVIAACGSTSTDEVDLDVPYVEQDGNFYCGPASVLMWRLYDGLAPVSQTEIAQTMGTDDACGTFAYRIDDGVRAYTNSGYDAIWDPDDYSNRDYFVARQITSVDSWVPVIAIPGSFHAGVVNGGHHHEIPDSGGMRQWDYVYFHDPQIGPDRYYDGDLWLDELCSYSGDACEQIISDSATGGWYNNYSNYHEDVVVGGGGGPGPGGDPPAY